MAVAIFSASLMLASIAFIGWLYNRLTRHQNHITYQPDEEIPMIRSHRKPGLWSRKR